MKKIIGYIITYIFYYIGCFFSWVSFIKIKNTLIFDMRGLRWIGNILFRLYNWFMIKSIIIQDYFKLDKPWINKEKNK